MSYNQLNNQMKYSDVWVIKKAIVALIIKHKSAFN